MDIHTLAIAQNAGYDAFNSGDFRAPTLSPIIREMIQDVEVGMGADDIFTAFCDGWEIATELECARILAED